MKNIFAFDIDGTLMALGQSKIDNYAEKSLKEAGKLGEVALASARPYRGITCLYPSDLAINHIIALNGAHITSGNIQKTYPISQETAKNLLSQSTTYSNFWIYTQDKWYANNPSTLECVKEAKGVSFEPFSLKEYKEEEILKITIVVDKDLENTVQKLKDISPNITVVTSSDTYIEIFSSKINKFKAINTLYPEEEVHIYSFGDSNNDREMIKNSFWGSAVDNATDWVKSSAKYVSKYKYGQGVEDSLHYIKSKFFSR